MKPDQGKPASQMPEESRRFDGALGEIEAQYRAIIESSADGFWVVGGDGPLIAVNDAYVRRSGYSRAELLGKRPRMPAGISTRSGGRVRTCSRPSTARNRARSGRWK